MARDCGIASSGVRATCAFHPLTAMRPFLVSMPATMLLCADGCGKADARIRR